MQGRALLTDRVFLGNRTARLAEFLRVVTGAIRYVHEADTREKTLLYSMARSVDTRRRVRWIFWIPGPRHPPPRARGHRAARDSRPRPCDRRSRRRGARDHGGHP